MRIKKRELIMILMLILYIVLRMFLYSVKEMSYLINPILWFILFSYAFFNNKDFKNRKRNRYDNTQSIVIFLFIFGILYFASGLIFGYQHNIYSTSLVGIIKNIMTFVFIIFFQEYYRYILLVKGPESYAHRILVTFLFILIDVDFAYIIQQANIPLNLLEYFCTTFMIIVIKNITLSFMSFKVDVIPNYLYRLQFIILTVFIPIVPKHEWLVTFLITLSLSVVIAYSIMRREMMDSRRINRKERDAGGYKGLVATIAVLTIMVLFVTQFFHYFPVAIISNSMSPYFKRGYVVVIEKKHEDRPPKVGDIVYYKYKDIMITHRVVEYKEENNKLLYKTKGDNNNANDAWWIDINNIDGIVRMSIPYIGYPTVLLSELF